MRVQFKNAMAKLFCYDKWNIGHILQTPEDFIAKKRISRGVKWLPEDSIDYRADPFPARISGRVYVMYEELSFWNGKGRIMIIDGFQNGSSKMVRGISAQNIHLSYPYLFKANGTLFCIPETCHYNRIDLFEVDSNHPEILINRKTLVSGAKFVDSSIVFFENRYWLFTSIANQYGSLYLYHSDSLLNEFVAHSLNPISVGIAQSRSAGSLFFVGNALYMPTQNPQRCYGGSIVVNRISKLTPFEFCSETCFEVFPQAPYTEGIHTINFCDGLLIIDGKRKIRSLMAPFKKAVKAFKNL